VREHCALAKISVTRRVRFADTSRKRPSDLQEIAPDVDTNRPQGQRSDMDVTLSPDSEQFVRQKLQHGDFHSPTDVVNAGLRLLRERDERWAKDVRTKIAVARKQLQQGKTLTPEQLEKNLAARKAKWKVEHGLA
jgi:putative addiction module CopG family antidote